MRTPALYRMRLKHGPAAGAVVEVLREYPDYPDRVLIRLSLAPVEPLGPGEVRMYAHATESIAMRDGLAPISPEEEAAGE